MSPNLMLTWPFPQTLWLIYIDLRLTGFKDSYDAKLTEICNFWTFWPVIKLINHLFQIRQKTFLPKAP